MKKREVLFLLISAFIMTLAWIGFNIYHNLINSTIPATLGVRISPINPGFDTQTLENLKKREKVIPLFTGQIETTPPIATPSVQISPTIPLSTGSANQATIGGSIQ